MMEDTGWDQEFESKCAIQGGEEFLELIANYAKENAPKRSQQGNGSKIPREKMLHNRPKILNREKHMTYSK